MAWCAGLYEGEGSVCLLKSRKTRTIRMAIGSTDRDVLESFQQIVGGNLGGPYKSQGSKTPGHYKEIWHWSTSRVDLVREILGKFEPYLSQRRKDQAAAALAGYGNYPRLPQRARKEY